MTDPNNAEPEPAKGPSDIEQPKQTGPKPTEERKPVSEPILHAPDPNEEGTEAAEKPSVLKPQERVEPKATDDDDLYEIAEADPDSAQASDPAVSQWYAARAGGQKQGPLTLAELKQRVASDRLTAEDLVWKPGMLDWVPARTIPDLFDKLPPPAPAAVPQPQQLPQFPPQPAIQSMPRHLQGEPMPGYSLGRMMDDAFSRPAFFRLIGRISAVLVPVVVLGSVISGALSGWRHTWFLGAVALALIFVIGEAVGAVLEALGRIETQSKFRESEEKPERDG